MKVVFALNIIVAGWVGINSLLSPAAAVTNVFSGAYSETEVIRLVGCLWVAIAILSAFGLFAPQTFSPVLLLQLIYKGGWLIVVALPAILNGKPYPVPMAVFFAVWVVVLPFVIPWSEWAAAIFQKR